MIRWLGSSTAKGQTVFRIGRDGDVLVAEWCGLGTLRVNRDGSESAFQAMDGADRALIAKLETGTMRALLRHLRGELTLHASGVESRGVALAFVGDSGAGKSTLAFQLSNAPGATFSLLSDDCLCLEDKTAMPSERFGWIDDDTKPHTKAPLEPLRVADVAAPLRAVIDLTYGDRLYIRRLRGAAAAATLGRATIRFVLDEPDVHRADMQRLAELASDVVILELARPRGMEHLAATTARIDALAGTLSSSHAASDNLESRIFEE